MEVLKRFKPDNEKFEGDKYYKPTYSPQTHEAACVDFEKKIANYVKKETIRGRRDYPTLIVTIHRRAFEVIPITKKFQQVGYRQEKWRKFLDLGDFIENTKPMNSRAPSASQIVFYTKLCRENGIEPLIYSLMSEMSEAIDKLMVKPNQLKGKS